VITLDPVRNAKAQQAALMMSANSALSHEPPASWLFYTAEGAEAAGKGNICIGAQNDPGCVALYMQDPGSNNAAVGHRRWILYPQTKVMGTGDVPGGGGYLYANALWVIDGNFGAARPSTRDTFVAWPAKGHSPLPLVPQRWSFSYPDADFSTATVTMQRNGVSVGLQLETVQVGFGENTIVWLPSGLPTSAPTDISYTVNVNNVRINGVQRNFTYPVTIFDPAITPPGTPNACPSLSVTSISSEWQGQGGTVSISAAANCAWTASTPAGWIQVYPLSGTGSGTLQYTVFPNFGTQARFATIAVNNTTVTIQQAANPGTPNERFAELLYFNYLGRLPGPTETSVQASFLNGGGSRADLAYNFFQASEFNLGGRFVAGLYVGLLDRDAEYSGWLFQRNAVATAQTNTSQLVASFLGSAEYSLKFGNPPNAEFIRLLYRHVLLREPAQPEVDVQFGALASGVSRTQLASSFLSSEEFRSGTGPRLFAFLLYATLLQRDSSAGERSILAGRLEAGLTLKAAIAEFLARQEHAALLQ
jgi:hypothetical protein